MIQVAAAGLTDVGRKRKGNEDALDLAEELNLFVVSDGMGGHQAGEVASAMVVRTVRDYMERVEKGGEVELMEDDPSLSGKANYLCSGIHLANRVVFEYSKSSDSYRGMGATISAICFTDDTIIAGNVGDSPIYLARKGKVETLSVPHTVIAEQMALNPEAAMQLGRSYQHMLTRAMGIEKEVNPDICEIQCFKDDILVIASDGLSDKASPEEVMKIVLQNDVEKSCRALVDLANERGGDDNITVIVIKVISVKPEGGGIIGWISRVLNKIFK